MNKRYLKALLILTIIVAILVPIFIAISISARQALREETSRVRGYAQDVIQRSDTTVDQIVSAFAELKSLGVAPCSAQSISVMKKHDLSSSYIQAVGYLKGDRFACISVGTEQPYEIGPPDIIHPEGIKIRNNVEFPFAKGDKFIVVEQDGYAAIVHKQLPIDATTAYNDISLATVSKVTGQIISSKGQIKPAWLSLDKLGREAVYRDDDYIVAVLPSTRYRITAVAALPISYLSQQAKHTAYIMAPVGLVAGLILAIAFYQLFRFQQSMPKMIRNALKRGEFYMEYQPVVDLKSGRWVGAEALIRWKRINGESIRPDIFIPIAEELGIISDITCRVIDLVQEGCGDIWRRFPDFYIAINLSQSDLHSEKVVRHFHRMVHDLGVLPRNIVIEVTERGLARPDVAREILQEMRKLGVAIAIDDFGTGYSSLAQLETFDLDVLKIDKTFVDSVGTDSTTSHVILHIIEMAKDLQLHMVAEGIETEGQAQFLHEHGVHYGQGWFYARAMSIVSLTRMLRDHA